VSQAYSDTARHGKNLTNRQSSEVRPRGRGAGGCHEDCTDRPVDGERAPASGMAAPNGSVLATEEMGGRGTPVEAFASGGVRYLAELCTLHARGVRSARGTRIIHKYMLMRIRSGDGPLMFESLHSTSIPSNFPLFRDIAVRTVDTMHGEGTCPDLHAPIFDQRTAAGFDFPRATDPIRTAIRATVHHGCRSSA